MIAPLFPKFQSLYIYCPARTYTWVSHRYFIGIRKRDTGERSQRCVLDVESSSKAAITAVGTLEQSQVWESEVHENLNIKKKTTTTIWKNIKKNFCRKLTF